MHLFSWMSLGQMSNMLWPGLSNIFVLTCYSWVCVCVCVCVSFCLFVCLFFWGLFACFVFYFVVISSIIFILCLMVRRVHIAAKGISPRGQKTCIVLYCITVSGKFSNRSQTAAIESWPVLFLGISSHLNTLVRSVSEWKEIPVAHSLKSFD